jgi:hypothetical protein
VIRYKSFYLSSIAICSPSPIQSTTFASPDIRQLSFSNIDIEIQLLSLIKLRNYISEPHSFTTSSKMKTVIWLSFFGVGALAHPSGLVSTQCA